VLLFLRVRPRDGRVRAVSGEKVRFGFRGSPRKLPDGVKGELHVRLATIISATPTMSWAYVSRGGAPWHDGQREP
jgi:hypothetical protein